jgi:dihydroxyacid dehydratase/phosphogluconate dehydratase
MADIDRLSRQVPCICKLAPASAKYHIEDCARAGGIATILGELDRAGKIHRDVLTVSGETIGEMIDHNDIRRERTDEFATRRSLAAPGNVRTVRKRHSPRTNSSIQQTEIPSTVVFAPPNSPTARMGDWPSYTGISPKMGVSLKLLVWMNRFG